MYLLLAQNILIRCLSRLKRRLRDPFAGGPHLEQRLILARKFSLMYKESGRFQLALNLELQILKHKKLMLSEKDALTLATIVRIATYLNGLYRYEEAAKIGEHLLKVINKGACGSIGIGTPLTMIILDGMRMLDIR